MVTRAQLKLATEEHENYLQNREVVIELCKKDPVFFINNFLFTYDPRKEGGSQHIPFILYDYQEDAVPVITEHIENGQDLLIEKSRDMGASWLFLAVAFWGLRFQEWISLMGSRNEKFVDTRGNMDSLFEKLRYMDRMLPEWLKLGFKEGISDKSLLLINPKDKSTISGESNNSYFGTAGRYKFILFDEFSKWEQTDDIAWRSCFSKDTEVLTFNGWKLIKDIGLDDKVYSMDMDTRKAEFMPVSATQERHYDKMIHFSGKSIDLLVSHDHNVLYETINSNLFLKPADYVMNLKSGSIPLVSEYNLKNNNPKELNGFNAGDWMEFLGWYISEGNMATYGGIKISQNIIANPDKVKRIDALLKRMDVKYSYKQNNHFYVFKNSLPEYTREELKSLGKCDTKHIPQRYINLSKELLERLWESLLLGDGNNFSAKRRNRNVDSIKYITTSKKLAGQVQELLQKIGYRGTIHNKKQKQGGIIRGRKIKGELPIYNICLGYKKRVNLNKLKSKYKDYNDFAYCVTTPYHTLYVRRNGIASWCGNSGDASPCRIANSTPSDRGMNCHFYKLIEQGIDKLTLHWTKHPDKNRGLYYERGDEKIFLNPDKEEDLEKANELWKAGTRVGSIWYDKECERRNDIEIAQELDIAYDASLAGAIFNKFDFKTQVENVEYRSNLPLYITFDFGIDTTAMLWIQSDGTSDYIIDEYQNKGEDIYHYIEVIESKPYKAAQCFGDPYSGGIKQMQSSSTVAQILQRSGIRMKLAQRVSINDRINASRARIQKTTVTKKCPLFLDTIANWRFKKPMRGNDKPTPEHSVFSHLGESYGYYAVGMSAAKPNLIKSRYR